MGIDDALRSTRRGMEDCADLAGEIEVGINQPERRSFTPARLVAMNRSFQRSGPSAATSKLGTDKSRDKNVATASMSLFQQCSEQVWGLLLAESVQSCRVENERKTAHAPV